MGPIVAKSGRLRPQADAGRGFRRYREGAAAVTVSTGYTQKGAVDDMRSTIAIGVLALGVLEFLSAIGILHHPVGAYLDLYWPALLMAWGVEIVWDHLRRGRGDLFFPIVLFLTGLAFLLQNAHLLGASAINPWNLAAGLFLIYLGIMMFKGPHFHFSFGHGASIRQGWRGKKKRLRRYDGFDFDMDSFRDGVRATVQAHRNSFDPAQKPADDGGSPYPPPSSPSWGKRQSQFAGEIRYGDSPWVLEPMRIHNTFGEIRVNLGTATIADGETPIDISVFAGEIRVNVPADLPVLVEVSVSAGEIRLFEQYKSGMTLHDLRHVDPGFAEAGRRVVIRIRVNLGAVRVTRVN